MIAMQRITPAAIARVIALVTAAVLLAGTGCGLIHKDVPVSATISVGGLPTSLQSFNSSDITAPLKAGAGDVSALSSVTMTFADLDSADGMDFSFISGGTITVSGPAPLTTVELAKLTPAPGAVGHASYTIENQPDLRPYLESSSGQIAVTITYPAPPIPARQIKVTLNFHATL
jgi:hypothetical protein